MKIQLCTLLICLATISAGAMESSVELNTDNLKPARIAPSLKSLSFSSYAPLLKNEIYPILCQELAADIAAKFPDTGQKLSFNTALTTLKAINEISCSSQVIELSSTNLVHSLPEELSPAFNELFKTELETPCMSRLVTMNCGLLTRCFEEVAYTIESKKLKFVVHPLADHPALRACVDKKVEAIDAVLKTKCQLPERKELRAQLVEFEDMLNNSDLLARLAGKNFTALVIDAQFEMSLSDYREYLIEKKNFSENKATNRTFLLHEQMLPVIFKNYPETFAVLKKALDKTSELIENVNYQKRMITLPNAHELLQRLSEPPLDYLALKTVIERFAGKQMDPVDVLESVHMLLEAFIERLQKGGQKELQAILIGQSCKMDLLEALFKDYPYLVKITSDAHKKSMESK